MALDLAEIEVANFVCNNPVSWESVVVAAIFASLLLLVFFYLLAVLFRNEKSVAWVKMELYELIATIMIVFVLISLTSGLCNFQASWIFTDQQITEISSNFPSDANMYEMAATYLSSIGGRLLKWMSLSITGAVIADVGSSHFNVHPMGQGFATSPTSGFFAPLKLLVNNAMIAMTITYVVNGAMLAILKYSIIAFSKYFLPLGILFRSIEPTRRFGGTLIALSITFLIIYPIILSVSLYVTEVGLMDSGFLDDIWDAKMMNAKDSFKEFGNDLFRALDEGNLFSDLLGGAITFVQAFATFVLTAFGWVFSTVFLLIGGYVVPWAALVGFIIPAFNTMVLVYSMRSLGKTLGEPVDITSLTRVI